MHSWDKSNSLNVKVVSGFKYTHNLDTDHIKINSHTLKS
jgi:hypothetical protein